MEDFKKIFLIIVFIICHLSLFAGQEINIGSTLPGEKYEISFDFQYQIDKAIPNCSCINNIKIRGNELEFSFLVENYKFLYPKKIYIFFQNSSIDTINITGTIEKILPEIEYYYSHTCRNCKKVKKYVEDFCKQNDIYVNLLNLNNEQNLNRLFTTTDQIGINKFKSNIIVYKNKNNDLNILNGENEIYKGIKIIPEVISNKYQDKFNSRKKNNKQLIGLVSLPLILISGLIDGINPCAFTTIIFFTSILTFFKFSRKKISIIGISFICGVFITYIIIGSGLIKIIQLINTSTFVGYLFNGIILILIIIFISLTTIDIIRYIKTKKTSSLLNQLPKKTKEKIHEVVRTRLKGNKIIVGSFIIGINISILEGLCTGQIYLPILRIIMKNNSLNIKAFFYLLSYNTMFILPLLIVFIVFYNLQKIEILTIFSKKYFLTSKIFLLCLFIIYFFLIFHIIEQFSY